VANQSLEEVIRIRLESLGVENADALAVAFGKLEAEAKQGEVAAQGLVEQLGKLSDTADEAANFAKLAVRTDELREKFELANEEAYSLKAALQGVEEPTKEMQAAFAKANRTVEQLGTRLSEQERALEQSATALRAAGVDTQKLVTEQARLDDEIRAGTVAAQAQVKSLQVNREAALRNAEALDRMAKSFATARDSANAIASKLAAAGAAATAAAAAFAAYKTGQFFVGAIESASEFEARISAIGAVTGASSEQLELLRETAEQAALDSGRNFGSVADTLGDLARAVGDAETAASTLKPTLDLATAGALDSAKAAEILTTTLTQFGLDASEATRIADLLATGANATTASVEQLGNSLSYAAPLARQLGMNVDETVAAIGALADEGFRGERAGTALRNVLSALSDPASKFSTALDSIGIKTRNFNEVVVELARRGDEGKRALMALDSEARPAILALVNSGATNIQRLSDSFARMEVTAASAAAKMRDNLSGAADQASVAFDNLRKELVEPLLEPLTDELQALSKSLRDFAQSPEFEQIRTALKDLFVDGVEAAKQFASTIDWTQLADQVERFATDASSALQGFGADAKEYLGYVESALDGLSVVLNALQTGILGLATAAAKLGQLQAQIIGFGDAVNRAVNPIAALAEKLGLYPDIAGSAQEAVAGLQGVVDEFADRTVQNAEETRAALDDLGTGFGEAGAGATEGAAEISAAGDQMATSGQKIVDSQDAIVASGAKLLEYYDESATASEASAARKVEAETSAASELATLQQRRLELQRQIDAAVASGASSEALRLLRAQYADVNGQVEELERLLGRTSAATKEVAASTQQVRQGFEDVADSASEAADAAEGIGGKGGESAQQLGTALGGVLGQLVAMFQKFSAISPAAAEFFKESYNGAVQLAVTLGDVAEAIARAERSTDAAIASQRAGAEAMRRDYEAVAEAGDQAGYAFQQAARVGSEGLRLFAEQARAGIGQLDLLNQADLDELGASAERAAERIAQIEQAARAALEQIAQLERAQLDELDRRAGNQRAILEREYQDQLAKLEELERVGGRAAEERARRARELLRQNFDAELAALQEQERAKIESDARATDAAIEEAKRRQQAMDRITKTVTPTAAGLGDRGRPVEVIVRVRNEQTGAQQFIEMTQLPDVQEALTASVLNALQRAGAIA
jgi:TP901 family phage tail tape measure protein